jgi:hypothetical protein
MPFLPFIPIYPNASTTGWGTVRLRPWDGCLKRSSPNCETVLNWCEKWLSTPSLASLFSKRSCALAGLFEDLFEDLKLFGVSIGKHSADFRGMLAEDWNSQVFAAFCRSDDSYPPIVGAFHPADQSFFEQAIDRHADGPGSEVDFRADRVYW